LFVLSDNVSINNILHHIIIETTTLIFNKVRKQRKELDYHTKLCAVTTPQHEHSEHKKGTHRKMSTCKKNISDDVIIIRREETFNRCTHQTDDYCAPR
jgi:hypothetical protein